MNKIDSPYVRYIFSCIDIWIAWFHNALGNLLWCYKQNVNRTGAAGKLRCLSHWKGSYCCVKWCNHCSDGLHWCSFECYLLNISLVVPNTRKKVAIYHSGQHINCSPTQSLPCSLYIDTLNYLKDITAQWATWPLNSCCPPLIGSSQSHTSVRKMCGNIKIFGRLQADLRET